VRKGEGEKGQTFQNKKSITEIDKNERLYAMSQRKK